MKGIFLDFKVQARCSVGHQGTTGDTEMSGDTEPSFPPYTKHLDFSEEFIFMLTDCETGWGFSSSGLEALHRQLCTASYDDSSTQPVVDIC